MDNCHFDSHKCPQVKTAHKLHSIDFDPFKETNLWKVKTMNNGTNMTKTNDQNK
jgi:hypothetical protein